MFSPNRMYTLSVPAIAVGLMLSKKLHMLVNFLNAFNKISKKDRIAHKTHISI